MTGEYVYVDRLNPEVEEYAYHRGLQYLVEYDDQARRFISVPRAGGGAERIYLR